MPSESNAQAGGQKRNRHKSSHGIWDEIVFPKQGNPGFRPPETGDGAEKQRDNNGPKNTSHDQRRPGANMPTMTEIHGQSQYKTNSDRIEHPVGEFVWHCQTV